MTSIDEYPDLRSASSVASLGGGRYGAELSAPFAIMDHPHGGFLQCVVASAALAEARAQGSAHPHVTALTTNFVNAPVLGPVELSVQVRKIGRSVTFGSVVMSQGGVTMLESLVTMGTLRQESVVRYQSSQPLELPARTTSYVDPEAIGFAIRQTIEFQFDPATTSWWDGQRSSVGEVRGWLRLRGELPWDPWSLLFASDAVPPATLPLGSSGWVPTLQLTSYIRRVPRSEWLRARQWVISISDGLVDERCELFDDEGQLVASSSQLAMVRLPGGN
ncbi:MAG TPA: thioesterase family protein [Acidimicrobiales bacterium]|nr:thioesterase family protein [Acidimicrobiales bacterium]